MLTAIAGLPEGVVGFEAHGRVRASDYREILDPALDREVERHGKAGFLYELGADFEGFSAGALYADLRTSVRHWRHFERVAFVTDSSKLALVMKSIAPLFPAPVRIFGTRDLDQAKEWVSSGAASARAAA